LQQKIGILLSCSRLNIWVIPKNQIQVADNIEHLLIIPPEPRQNPCAILEEVVDLVEFLFEKTPKDSPETTE
jgi:hypothetical protein